MNPIEAGEGDEGEFHSSVQHPHSIDINMLMYQDIRNQQLAGGGGESAICVITKHTVAQCHHIGPNCRSRKNRKYSVAF